MHFIISIPSTAWYTLGQSVLCGVATRFTTPTRTRLHEFSTEAEAQKAIDGWRQESPRAQRRNIQLAIESLELSEMHYEQKGNAHGLERAGRCIALLRLRLAELDPAGDGL